MYALLYKIVRIFKRSFFIVKNIKTKLFFLIAVLSFAVSCSNQTTRPELSTESTSKVYGYKTVYYGNKTFTDNITQEKIESLWKNMIKDKTVYANSSYGFKFFKKSNWGEEDEEWSSDYTLLPEGYMAVGDNGFGVITGDCIPGDKFPGPGIYELTIDIDAKTMTMELIEKTE